MRNAWCTYILWKLTIVSKHRGTQTSALQLPATQGKAAHRRH